MDSKVEALKGKGNELYQKQEYLEAITYYTSALELDPSHVISLGNRSACYLALGRNDEADADARRAISLDKSYVKGYFRLASALKNRNLFFEAAGVASLGLEVDSGNVALKKIKVECSKHTSTTKESKDGFRKKMFGELYSDKEHTSQGHTHTHNGCCGHHHHHHHHPPEDADTTDVTSSLNEDAVAMYKYLKMLVKRIIKGEFGNSDVSNHMLQGTFRQLVEPESFSDVLFPGVPNEVSDTLPRNLLQLMSWNSMDELIMNSLVKMAKSAAKILEGVRRKGEARGDIMDDATKVILVPQIAQETFAREVVDIVKNLSKRASNINARLNLDLASPGADDAGLDQLDPETMQVLMEGEGIAVQDAFIGNVWCGLVTADAIRYASSEKMTSTTFSNQITSIGAAQEAHLKQHNARIAWVEQKEICASYPALAEAIQNLHALPYEINAKTNTSLMLLEPCRGFTMLAHFPAGGSQPPRLDNHPGENDAGLRLTCAYHLVPYDQSVDEPRCSSRGQYILQTEKKTTQRIDIVNDRLVLYKSQSVVNERTAATKDYYVLYFYIHGMS